MTRIQLVNRAFRHTTRKTIGPGDQSHFLLLTTETGDSDVLIDSQVGSQFCGYAGRLSSSQIVVIRKDDSAICSSEFGPTGIEL
ncbi:MAG: hypothetical protein U0271_12805 [Polyangiaceae bacterium]